MFNPSAHENAGPRGIGVLEIIDGELAPDGERRSFVPLKRTGLRGEALGPLASLRLAQEYGYAATECDRVLEAVYRFPLPGDAAVTGVRVQFGDVEVRTELRERAAAAAEYAAAREQGRQAALLSRESPDVFTLRLSGLRPDQPVTVETSYVQRARAEGAGWSLRVPLTTAPRYVRSDELTARHAQGQPLALLRDPGHRFCLDLEVVGAGRVSSPTHALALQEDADRIRVRLQEGEVIPDRDCVVVWQPRQERDRPSFHVWLHDDRGEGEVDFLALVAPPAAPEPGAGVSREVILLVDHSGSMQGAKWEAADWAVRKFLSELGERDLVNLGLFHNSTRWFAEAPRVADAGTVAAAVHFLEAHRDSGGTELGVALEQALDQRRAAGEYARHVLVLTDAQVTDAGRILRLVHAEAGREDRRRISVLCIDAAPNSTLALELAERGGGIARFLTSDPEQEDIATALDEVLADWSQPVLAGLQLAVDRPKLQAPGLEVREHGESESRLDLGDLPAGRAVWRVGRAPRGTGDTLTFRVLDARGREVKTRLLDLAREAHDRPALRALFGARRILGLEHLIPSGLVGEELAESLRRLGYDAEAALAAVPTTPRVYAENTRRDNEAALRRLLVEESLRSGLISSETAFIAVRRETGKPVQETVVVANAVPAGWSEAGMFRGGPSRVAAMAASPMDHRMRLASHVPPAAPLERQMQGVKALSLDAPIVAAAPSGELREEAAPVYLLFSGVPSFEDGAAVLFDTERAGDAGKLPEDATFAGLSVRFPGGAPPPDAIAPGLCLEFFVGDLSQPRARVRLADLLRQGGRRPVNLRRRPGERVRIVLLDPAAAWAGGAPSWELRLA
jgi:Ca-activated chloride channel family protein